MRPQQKLSVIIPAYDEGKRIYGNLLAAAKALRSVRCEFIVVDDGSSDDTYAQAQRAAKRLRNMRVVRYDENEGKGFALRYGFRYATGDLVAFLDADMDLPPGQVLAFIKVMQETGSDVVIGSKNHPDTRLDYPLHRKIASRAYQLLLAMLFTLPLSDTQVGLKLFRRRVLSAVFPKLLVKRFAFDIELLANAHRMGFKIAEAPIILTKHQRFGRIKLRDVCVMFLDTMAVAYRMHVLRSYG
jgi:glycosyltransferase involved in cell wall biosynthesis